MTLPRNYQQVQRQIDLSNFIDYYLAEIYLSNMDWPARNINFWQPRRPDGQWRWIFFDCDMCMVNSRHDFVQKARRGDYPDWSVLLLTELLKNPDFRQRYYSRLAHLLQTRFTADRVISVIDSLYRQLAPHVPEHVDRWQQEPSRYQRWEENVQTMRRFAVERQRFLTSLSGQRYRGAVQVYPNPAANQAFVSSSINFSVQVDCYTPSGTLARSWQTDSPLASPLPLNLSGLSPGLYLLRIQAGRQLFTRKLLVTDR